MHSYRHSYGMRFDRSPVVSEWFKLDVDDVFLPVYIIEDILFCRQRQCAEQ